MTSPALGPTRGGGARRWWIASAVLLVVAGVLLVTSLQDAPTAADPMARAADPVSTVEPTPAIEQGLPAQGEPAAGEPAVAEPAVGAPFAETAQLPDPLPSVGARSFDVLPLTQRSAPVDLRIPAIDVAVAVSELGLNVDETVEVPTDFQMPGWYRLGTAPGQLGSAVILGHVDSRRGPAVFFRLRALRAGDAVEVTLADGAVARFAVTEVATYPKDRFPAEQVYGSHGHSALVLVTCGGEFDRAARSYRSNVVVYSTLVETVPPG